VTTPWALASPGAVALVDDEVHIWRLTLDPPGETLARFEPTLNDDELRRADRFRTETLRRRFVAGRGSLRVVLSAYLNCPAGEIRFAYGNHGKPRLMEEDAGSLRFNLAHTHELAVCAVTLGREIGVDVEQIRPLENAEKIIHRFFSAREQAEFLDFADSERLAAFYRGWSRKEAFLKATGTGLSTQLDSFDVTLGQVASLLRVGDDPTEAPRWILRDLDAGPGYASAVAARCERFVLKLWDGLPAY
jgi:4'-phosphopantetheinyl transferase